MKRRLVLIASAMLTCSPALAQERAASAPVRDADSEQAPVDPLRFDSEVTVTGTRSETTKDGAPVSTAVVVAEELETRNSQTLDQALDLLPGLYVFRTRGAADTLSRVSMRGFNGSNRNLVLLDGQPLNDAYTGEVTWSTLPIGEIDRIEVVRGPFSALYGGTAMGGVINVLTRPIERRQLTASAQGGTYGTVQASGHYGDRVGAFGVSAGYQRLQTDGYVPRLITVAPAAEGPGTPVTGAVAARSSTGTPAFIVGDAGKNWYDQDAVRLKGEWTPNATTSLSVQYLHQRFDYGYAGPATYLRDASGSPVDAGAVLVQDGDVLRRFTLTPGSFLQGPGSERSHLAGATLHRLISGTHALRVSGGVYRQPDAAARTPIAATATASGGPGTIAWRDSRSAYANVQDTWTLSGHVLSAGMDIRHERADNEEFQLADWTVPSSQQAQSFASTGRTRSIAGYVQDQIAVGDRVTLAAGARIDRWRTFDGAVDIFNPAVPAARFDARTSSSLNGKASASFRPAAGWTVRGSAGTAFRNPTVFELYRTFRLSTGTVFAANPDLQPERLFSVEASVARAWGGRGSFEATWFRNRVTDLIYRKTDLAVDPTGRYRVLVNAGEGATTGVELAASKRIASTVLLRGSYTFTDAIISRNPALPDTEGKRVPNIPDHMASAAIFIAHGRWSGSVTGRYVSRSFGLDTNLDTTTGVPGSYSPFFVAGGSATFKVTSRAELFASVENLLDRQYYVFYLNPGRSLSAGARVRLGHGR